MWLEATHECNKVHFKEVLNSGSSGVVFFILKVILERIMNSEYVYNRSSIKSKISKCSSYQI